MYGYSSPEGFLFDEFRRLQSELDEFFGQSTSPAAIRSLPRGTFPATNIGANAEKVEVYVFAPGVTAEDLDISIQQNLLTVSGRREIPEHKDANFYRQERFSGDFRRVITLPDDVDGERVEARFRDGVLHISIPRRVPAKPRQIQIQ